ncbi:MAG: BrnA antitoxin family protein [Deltaproteobacteria bacterium]|nr:BrnA antitoxin family protein [Deltaproteobacteria bacterium]
MTEEELVRNALADPDAQPTDEAFWREAEVRQPVRKVSVSMKLDADVLEWFKAQGKGYQNRINAVLKAYKEAHR